MRVLVYSMSGELDDVSHLFPNERLARIASIVVRAGHEVDIIDRANLPALMDFGSTYLENLGSLPFHDQNELYQSRVASEAALVLEKDYGIIFLNLWQGTGFKFSIDLAKTIKARNRDVKIFGVGQKVDWFKETILHVAGDGIDGLITGLGYNAVEGIMTGQDPRQCPNTIFVANGAVVTNPSRAIDVDAYPAPSYEPVIYHGIEGKIPIRSIALSNQACPNGCVYCMRPENYGRTTIRRKLENVLDEMQTSFLRDKVSVFRIEDSTPPAGSLTSLARELSGSALCGKVRFTSFGRVDTNAAEDFALLKSAGCEALFLGIESLDDENLRKLKKGITFEQVRATLEKVHSNGIFTIGSLIFPIPGETEATMSCTQERLRELKSTLDSILVLPAAVYPPTEWGHHPEQHGIELDPDYFERFVVFPMKYLFPVRSMPKPPFRYGVMGKSANEVGPAILTTHDRFLRFLREELRIPPIPDYYYSLSKLYRLSPREFTLSVTNLMMKRDYGGLERILTPGDKTHSDVAAGCHKSS